MPFVELIADAAGRGVVDQDVVVHVLTLAREVEAVQRRLDAAALHHGADLVAHQRAAKGRERLRQPGVCRNLVARLPDQRPRGAADLQPVVAQLGAAADDDVVDQVGQTRARRPSMTWDSIRFRRAPSPTTTMLRGLTTAGGSCSTLMNNSCTGRVQRHAVAQANQAAIRDEGLVQRAERAPGIGIGKSIERRRIAALQGGREAGQRHAVTDRLLVRQIGRKMAVDEHQVRGAADQVRA